MKKFIFLIILFICLFMCSCEISENPKDYEIIDNIEVSFSHSIYQSSDGSCNLYLYIDLVSHNSQQVKATINSAKIIRKSNSAVYSVSTNILQKSVVLQCDLKEQFSFTSTIPTNLVGETYRFYVSLLVNKTLKEYTYDMSEPLPKDITISFNVDGEIVHQEVIKEGEKLSSIYTYENSDHLTHVSDWYDGTKKVTTSIIFNDDVVLEGKETSNIEWLTTGSDMYSFLQKITYVHSDGVLIVPEKALNKELVISNYGIYNNVQIEVIYLPSTIHNIYFGNFTKCPNLKTIYYAGTESMWKEIIKDKADGIPSGINVIYETTYSYDN